MTVSEAAEMWKISKSTVYKYCKNNFVECEKKNNVWVISDNHPKPLNIRKQKITQIKIEYFIPKALNSDECVSNNSFSYSKKKFEEILNQMVDCQLIIKVDNTEFDIPNNYILTPCGERIIIEKKEKNFENIKRNIKNYICCIRCSDKNRSVK